MTAQEDYAQTEYTIHAEPANRKALTADEKLDAIIGRLDTIDGRLAEHDREFADIKQYLRGITSFMNKGFGFSDPALDKLFEESASDDQISL